MKIYNISEFTRGWFVGDFEPSLFKTQNVEVAVQTFTAGDFEAAHYHKVATEITVMLIGEAVMFNRRVSEGDIVLISPGEATSFEALTDCKTVVVKVPGALNDKYLLGD